MAVMQGALVAWVKAVRPRGRLHLDIVKRPEEQVGFKVLPRRWVVERTFGWFMKQRRLVRDYEAKPEHAEAMLYIAMTNTHATPLDQQASQMSFRTRSKAKRADWRFETIFRSRQDEGI